MLQKNNTYINQNKSVCIVMPVYNEGLVVKKHIEEIKMCFTNIVCVDDGSSDNTLEQLKSSGVYVVSHPFNMGQGASLQTGVEVARAMDGIDYFVTVDADGQHRVQDILKVAKEIKKNKHDVVLGSRFLKAIDGVPFSKRMFLKMATKFSNAVSGIKLTDTHNGLRSFNRDFAEPLQIEMSDMAHASEILDYIKIKRFSYKEVPVKILYTDYSMSKGQSLTNAVNICFDIILKRIAK